MPASWHERMGTIDNYQQDGSALGRINAWWFAFNLAKDNPLFGGGFRTFDAELFKRYAPNPDDFHDAHSIYFEVMAEQGFVGLALFLLLGALVMVQARRIVKQAKLRRDFGWAANLAAMIQVALVGYMISGAFLGLAYFDLVYHLLVVIVILGQLLADTQQQEAAASAPRAIAPAAVAPPLPTASRRETI